MPIRTGRLGRPVPLRSIRHRATMSNASDRFSLSPMRPLVVVSHLIAAVPEKGELTLP